MHDAAAMSALPVAGVWVRWIARALSVVVMLILLAFLVGEGFPLFHLRGHVLIQFLLFPCGLFVALLLGWRHELLAGVVAAVSLAGFYAIELAANGSLPRGPWFLIFAAPAFLFPLAQLLSRASATAPQ
jgi:hypothetical protein